MRVAVLVAAILGGVIVAAESPTTPRRDPGVETLVAEAAAVAPEFSADVLLRLAALPQVDRAWKRELIEDAFVQAHAAPDPVKVAAPYFVPLDSRPAARVRAAHASLDRVSLSTRAALMMAAVDSERGRELFETIDFDREPPPCRDALVPDLELYYTASAQIARRRYPVGHDPSADALAFFGYHVWRARLATELPAVLKAIIRFSPTRDETLFLDGVIRVILDRGVRDPRGLSVAGADLIRQAGTLVDIERRQAIGRGPLLAAIRKYLVDQLFTVRCGDETSPSIVAASFNRMLHEYADDIDNVQPLPLTTAARVLAPARIDLYWQGGAALWFRQRLEELTGPVRRPIPLDERLKRDWQERAAAFLDDLEAWIARRDVDDADGFYEKQMIAGRFIEVAPTVELRLQAARIMIEEQRRAAPAPAWRNIWFVPETGLVELARSSSEILDLLERSPEPVLSLYARVERIAPAIRRRAD